ncbi:MAG: hypothetical protein D4S01_05085 [Dehalococcoidia bacterium]|nr:MAG: hypothetical protein D4S01_05085 [Dehalococcoidia bacterium]
MMRDKYNRPYKIGDSILVDEEWLATIDSFKPKGLIVVCDQDDNYFNRTKESIIHYDERGKGMVIETLIGKTRIQIMEMGGYTFDWKIENMRQAEEAIKKGIDVPEEVDWSTESYVHFWVDQMIEEYLPVPQLFDEVKNLGETGEYLPMLPLLINSNDREIAAEAKKRLENP